MLPKLGAVKVIFLPPNTTSKIQPLDAGIVASMKVQYRRRQMEKALDLIDCNEKDVYKLDQLTGMRWINDVWEGVSNQTIAKCWRHAGLIDENLPPGLGTVELVEMEKEKNAVQGMIRQVVGRGDMMAIDQFLNPEGESDCTEQISEQSMVEFVMDSINDTEKSESATVADPDRFKLPCLKEQMNAVAMVKLLVDNVYHDETPLLRGLQRIQKELRFESQKRAKQTRIDTYLRND